MQDRIAIIALQPKPFRFAISRLLMWASCSQCFSIRREGYRLRFFPTSLSAALWINAKERSGEEAFLRQLARPGEATIDVGANIGSIALTLAVAVGPDGYVLAVEPHPRSFEFLSKNIALNQASQIVAVQCALGAETGEVRVSDGSSDDQNAVGDHGISVPLRRLDDLAPEREISLLKIDVEGYEHFVLAGAAQVLKRTQVVYFEFVPSFSDRYGVDASSPWEIVIQSGFGLYEQHDNALRAASLPPTHKTMLIGIKDQKRFSDRTGLRFI